MGNVADSTNTMTCIDRRAIDVTKSIVCSPCVGSNGLLASATGVTLAAYTTSTTVYSYSCSAGYYSPQGGDGSNSNSELLGPCTACSAGTYGH